MNKTRLAEVQRQTWDDLCETLSTYGYCCVERPTGFGKTKLFMDYVKRSPDRMFLYIYDVNSVVEDITKKYAPTNIEFLSYAMLSQIKSWPATKAYIASKAWKAIIFDEAHLMGGTNIAGHLREILPLAHNAGVQIIGGTATPIRTDLTNVRDEFFQGHGVFEYSLEDAIREGIMQEPCWVLTVHFNHLLAQLREQVAVNSFQSARLNQLDRAYAKLEGVDKVYRQTVEEVFGDIPAHMQFIAFYPTILALEENKGQLVKEFSGAFPKHKVVCTAISSDPEHYSDIVEIEEQIERSEGEYTIHLILAVDMLNQAYHSNKLTGIIMNRATASNIIFTQQLGRCLSVVSESRAIVFDNVGNATINPDTIITSLASMLQLSDKSTALYGPREHRELKIRVSPQVLRVLDWYRRIKSTSQLTPEMVEYARRLREEYEAPDDFIGRSLSIPTDCIEDILS